MLKNNGCEGYIESHIVYSMVYWEDQYRTLGIDSTVQTYKWESCLLLHELTEQLRNIAAYARSNTPLYSQNRDSWHSMRMVQHTELECGMRLCLAASMIAQYRGTIPNRVKSCR
jgi:hypothetical protein